MRIEVLLDLKTRLGESPVWDVEQQRLWWVDSLDGRLFAIYDLGVTGVAERRFAG